MINREQLQAAVQRTALHEPGGWDTSEQLRGP